jgi:hypothetical protein
MISIAYALAYQLETIDAFDQVVRRISGIVRASCVVILFDLSMSRVQRVVGREIKSNTVQHYRLEESVATPFFHLEFVSRTPSRRA